MARHYPDGLCLDESNQTIWIASPGKKEVICINAKGKIIAIINTQSIPFDCILGGNNNKTLFIGTTDAVENSKTGKIEYFNLS